MPSAPRPRFFTLTLLSLGSLIRAAETGDFDGDGRLTIADAEFYREGAGRLRSFRGLGDETFTAQSTTSLRSVPIATTAAASAPERIAVLFADGLEAVRALPSGEFVQVAEYRLPEGETSTAASATERVDEFLLATQDARGARVRELAIEAGDALAVRTDSFAGLVPAGAISALDLDGDGRRDIVHSRDSSSQLLLHRGTREGFASARTFPLGVAPAAARSADLDRDTHRDFLVLGSRSLFHLTAGDADTFRVESTTELPAIPVTFPPDTYLAYTDPVFLDSDGDGILEVALIASSSHPIASDPGRVVLAFLDGAGGLSWTTELFTSEDPIGLAAGDFDADGFDELAVAGRDAVVLVFGSPAGPTVESARYDDLGGALAAVTAADFDGDGALDLAVAGGSGTFLLRNDGAGNLAERFSLPAGARVRSIEVAETTGDGVLDLAVLEESLLAVHENPASGGSTRHELVLEPTARSFAASDLDGDGLAEVAVLHGTPRRLSVFRNTEGALGAPEEYFTGPSAHEVLLEDIDGDGEVEAVVLAGVEEGLLVFPAGPGQRRERQGFRRGDADDDGTVQLTDAIAIRQYLFLRGPEPRPPGPSACGPDPTADALTPCETPCRGAGP